MNMRIGVFNNTAVHPHWGCYAVMTTLVDELERRGCKTNWFWPVGVDWKPYRKKIKREKFDGVVINAEGSIHNSATRKRAKNLCSLVRFCKEELRVPVVVMNATFYNLEQEDYDNLGLADLIFVRETNSKDLLYTHGLTSSFVPDLSFFSHNVSPNRLISKSGFLVFDSVLDDATQVLTKWCKQNNGNFVYIDKRMKPSSVKPKGWSCSRIFNGLRWRFRNAVKRVSQRFPIVQSLGVGVPRYVDLVSDQITKSLAFEDFVEILSSSEGVVTGRFHAMTLALSVRTPVMCVDSNTPKIEFVLKDIFGNSARVVSAESLVFDSTCHPLSSVELVNLDNYLLNGKEQMHIMFDSIVDLFEGAHSL